MSNNIHYTGKSWLSIDDQLHLLESRGMIIDDYEKARNKLSNISYYRLSGYWYTFRPIKEKQVIINQHTRKKSTKDIRFDHFIEGTRLQDVIDLYVFDKKLRILCLDALERIEVALRTRISYYLGKSDPTSYLDYENFLNKDFQEHIKWLSKNLSLISRSKEDFIKHNCKKYGDILPIWVASEVWDFGALSRLYSLMVPSDKLAVAKMFGVSDGDVFASWLKSLNYLRNICAHHGRLWNINILEQPKLSSNRFKPTWLKFFYEINHPTKMDDHKLSKVSSLMFILREIISVINPNSTWRHRVTELFQTDFPSIQHLGIDYSSMGFRNDLSDWLK